MLTKLPSPKNAILALNITFTILIGVCVTYLVVNQIKLAKSFSEAKKDIEEVTKIQKNFAQNVSSFLYDDHLKVVESIATEANLASVEIDLENLEASQKDLPDTHLLTIFTLFDTFKTKLARNTSLKLDVTEANTSLNNWGSMLLNKGFEALESSISTQVNSLDTTHNKYLASLSPAPTPGGGSKNGYSFTTVSTEKGTYSVYLIKVKKSEVRVKTIAAIEDDCKNNCATKSLAQYAKENNAWAGITGSYACPADYPSCAGKIWSFNFALYDSNDNKWLNKKALSWFETGMMTFNGSSSKFYRKTSEYGGGGVTAAVSNFPSLLRGGEVVVDNGDTDSYQEIKGLRGAIGTDDSNIYLVYVSGASVTDTAYVMKALGARDALNLDGGGTAAMYVNGGYTVGPGRPLANAILLIR